MFTSYGVVVPDVGFTPTDTQLDYIQENFNPLQRSDYNGVDVYIMFKRIYCIFIVVSVVQSICIVLIPINFYDNPNPPCIVKAVSKA